MSDDASTYGLSSDSEDGQEMDQLIKDYIHFHGAEKEAKDRADAILEEIIRRTPEGTTKILTDRFVAPIGQNTYTQYHWDKMPAELKFEIARYKEKKKSKKFLRNVKGLG